MGPLSPVSFYDLKEPTVWAQPPSTFSYSSLQALRTCPRRWQLVHSAWGPYPRFPERPQAAAIEGQIVHEALDLLARELGRRGRPPIASAEFRAALEWCGFWPFFATQVDDWNRRLAAHPRAGPRYVLRTNPRDLANQAVRLFREQYRPGAGLRVDAGPGDGASRDGSVGLGASPLSLLHARGALSEVRLEHPSLPLVGVLDLVALERDHSTTVVDFKTGARKPAHEEQVLLYVLLWWRATGTRPERAIVQYLDSSWVLSPTDTDLLAAERSVAEAIVQARDVLAAWPAAARPGQECTWCTVRPRCSEGWAFCGAASGVRAPSPRTDLEVAVSSNSTPTGFTGTRPSGEEVSIVFEAAVGLGLPPAKTGDRFRVVDAALRGQEIALLPWTEMYRL